MVQIQIPDTEEQLPKPAPSGRDLPVWRKNVILFIVSWMTLSATFSSTCLFPATPEIALELETTEQQINISNAGVLLVMGSSSLLWAPIVETFGRRIGYNAAIAVLFVCSIGTALSINMHMFVAMRILAGFEGTFMMLAGQTIIADIFDPKRRGTAVGLLQVGSNMGPSLGPCIGGVIVTYTSWRVMFWLQSGMAGLGLLLSILVIPQIPQEHHVEAKPSIRLWARSQRSMFRVFTMLIYPNVFLTDLACGLLAWSQYSLLAAPRHLINPRFGFTSGLQSGLFYLAPGSGFLLGSVLGGKFSDMTMIKQTKLRGGERVPQDRLYSGMWSLFFIVPVASVIYGWCLDFTVGGLVVPIISAFFTGFGLMVAFSSMNTYCAEAIPEHRTAVIASKYFMQYLFGAAGSAAIIPLIDTAGIGLASTLGAILAVLAGIVVLTVAHFGSAMRIWAEVLLHPVPCNEKEDP